MEIYGNLQDLSVMNSSNISPSKVGDILDDKADNLEETLTDTKEFFQELFEVPED